MTRQAGDATGFTEPVSEASGFTLLEMMVVLAVLAAVAALAVPRLSAANTAVRAAVETRRIITVLRSTRAEALASGRPVTIRPLSDPDQPAVTFFPDGGATAARYVLPTGAVITVDWLSGQVRRAPD